MLINTNDILYLISTLALRKTDSFTEGSFLSMCKDIEDTLLFGTYEKWCLKRDWGEFWSKASVQFMFEEKECSVEDFLQEFSRPLFLIHPYVQKDLPQEMYDELLQSDFYYRYPFTNDMSVIYGTDGTKTVGAVDVSIGKKYKTTREKLLELLTEHKYTESVTRELMFEVSPYLEADEQEVPILDLIDSGTEMLIDLFLDRLKMIHDRHAEQGSDDYIIPVNEKYSDFFETTDSQIFQLHIHGRRAPALQDTSIEPLQSAQVLSDAKILLSELIEFARTVQTDLYIDVFSKAKEELDKKTLLKNDVERILFKTEDNKKLFLLAHDMNSLFGMYWNSIRVPSELHEKYSVLSNKLAILTLSCFCVSLSE